ncbi:MAG: hypothetical protein ACR2JO_15200 [Mycobacteriales bacterium]
MGYLLKLARISSPTGLLELPLLARIAGLLPVALRPGSSPQALSSPWWSTLASSGLALPWQLCCCAIPFLGVVVAAAAVTALSRLAVG